MCFLPECDQSTSICFMSHLSHAQCRKYLSLAPQACAVSFPEDFSALPVVSQVPVSGQHCNPVNHDFLLTEIIVDAIETRILRHPS